MDPANPVIFSWLERIGLSYAIPNFQAAGIANPTQLTAISFEQYDELGVVAPDDRKKLFELVHRIKEVREWRGRGGDGGIGSSGRGGGAVCRLPIKLRLPAIVSPPRQATKRQRQSVAPSSAPPADAAPAPAPASVAPVAMLPPAPATAPVPAPRHVAGPSVPHAGERHENQPFPRPARLRPSLYASHLPSRTPSRPFPHSAQRTTCPASPWRTIHS